jgi:Rnl2 family RNA ligase
LEGIKTKFKKYNSIDNSYREKTLFKIKTVVPSDEVWIVTEKLHGVNFSIWYDGHEIKYARRSGFIKENENFYNYDIIKNRYETMVEGLYEYNDHINELVLYGELIGGSYPHPNVEKLNIKTIQKGVFYTNTIDFVIFDIMVNGKYLSYYEMNDLLWATQFKTVPYLFSGTLKDCLEYPNDNVSIMCKQYDLPSISDNICEGVVIKPNKPLFFNNESRIILKNKNEKFSEKKKIKKVKKEIMYSYYLREQIDKINEYINTNRLNNVLSKYGEYTMQDFSHILKLFIQDVYNDFFKDNEVKFSSKEDSKLFSKTVSKLVVKIMKENI